MKQKAGELKASPQKNYCEVIDRLQGLTEAYIRIEPREITKETKTKSYYKGIIWEETKNCNEILKRQKAGEQWRLDE